MGAAQATRGSCLSVVSTSPGSKDSGAAWRKTEILDAYKIARVKWETWRFAIAKTEDKGPDSASH